MPNIGKIPLLRSAGFDSPWEPDSAFEFVPGAKPNTHSVSDSGRRCFGGI